MTFKIRFTLAAAAACALLSLAPAAWAQTASFSFFSVPDTRFAMARDFAPGGGSVGYKSKGLNYQGFVLGADGQQRTVAVPGARSTLIYGSRKGQVMGQVQMGLQSSTKQGFIQDAKGRQRFITAPDGQDVAVYDINSQGTLVGTYDPDTGDAEMAGFVLKDGVFTQYKVPGAFDTELTAITDDGTMVGSYRMASGNFTGFIGFIDRAGVRTLVQYPGAHDTVVTGINKAGVVSGYYGLPGVSGFLGFVYDGSRYTTVAPEGATNCYLWGINDDNQAIGFTYFGNGSNTNFVATLAP